MYEPSYQTAMDTHARKIRDTEEHVSLIKHQSKKHNFIIRVFKLIGNIWDRQRKRITKTSPSSHSKSHYGTSIRVD
jgi:hypothetical protein